MSQSARQQRPISRQLPARRSRPGPAAALVAFVLGLAGSPATAQELNEDAAVALIKKSHCLKCHSIEKRKSAPSYKEIAVKFKGRADAEPFLYKHLTSGAMVKSEDGDESHATLPGQDEAAILNVIRWILSR